MSKGPVAGRSIVTRRAIADIVRTAVQSSYGVTGFADPSLIRRLLRWIGFDRSGIRLSNDGGLILDLYVTVAFGVPVAEVARQVDSAVRYSLRHIVGVEVATLAIHVDGLRYQPHAVERAHEIELTDVAPQPATQSDEVAAGQKQHTKAAAGDTAARKRPSR
jgi:uncharacterized alkaline shock family protein YloU